MNLQAATGVSRETDIGIYERLLTWAVWATDRRDIFERRDQLAGDFRITAAVKERMIEARSKCFPRGMETIEKAVGALGLEHDDKQLQFLVKQYFIEWKSIETIALEQRISEFHVEEGLHRALRKLARRLSTWA